MPAGSFSPDYLWFVEYWAPLAYTIHLISTHGLILATFLMCHGCLGLAIRHEKPCRCYRHVWVNCHNPTNKTKQLGWRGIVILLVPLHSISVLGKEDYWIWGPRIIDFGDYCADSTGHSKAEGPCRKCFHGSQVTRSKAEMVACLAFSSGRSVPRTPICTSNTNLANLEFLILVRLIALLLILTYFQYQQTEKCSVI